jgi:hypothetical protein
MTESRCTTKVPAHLRILCSLFFFGQGSYQVGIGHRYLVAQSQPSIRRCISERRHQIKEQFQQRGIFEDVLGIIDCTHIRIIAPPEEHPLHPAGPYYCRKGYYT